MQNIDLIIKKTQQKIINYFESNATNDGAS